jgi:thiamine transport system ATP-binding protein
LPEELRAIFAELGLTVIYVTHDQDEALTVADRVVLLDAGRLVADGTPEALWMRPPNAWTARFLGFRNIAPAQVVAAGLETPWGRIPYRPGPGHPAGSGLTVVVRPAALVASADGPIRGHVAQRRFRGDHVSLIIAVEGAPPLHVEAREGVLPATGDAVALAVLPGGFHLIEGSDGPAAGAATLPSGT